jgi:hypothetical protein
MCWVGLSRSLWIECGVGCGLCCICADFLMEARGGTFSGPMAGSFVRPVELCRVFKPGRTT